MKAQNPDFTASVEAALLTLASRPQWTAEDLRKLTGDPPSPNSFGGYFKELARRRVIKHVGFTWTARKPARKRAISLWAVVQGGLH